jgi:hypothetical protein
LHGFRERRCIDPLSHAGGFQAAEKLLHVDLLVDPRVGKDGDPGLKAVVGDPNRIDDPQVPLVKEDDSIPR